MNCRLVARAWRNSLHEDALVWRHCLNGGATDWRRKVAASGASCSRQLAIWQWRAKQVQLRWLHSAALTAAQPWRGLSRCMNCDAYVWPSDGQVVSFSGFGCAHAKRKQMTSQNMVEIMSMSRYVAFNGYW